MKSKHLVVLLTFLLLPLSLMAGSLDSRKPISIPAKFKPQILADMRENLAVVRGIVAGLAADDFEQVEKLASTLASMDHSDEVMQRRQLVPEGYRALGPKMHLGFQAIARDARDFGDVQHSLEQLSDVMSICLACHQAYRLEVTEE